MVVVVIKAANGAVADFSVSCATPNWTAAQLKNYLYRHYPTHPPVTSQKLIYSGRLLLDSQQLKDAIPQSENNDRVVIHLVAYERSASAPAIVRQPSAAHSLSPVREAEGEEEEENEEEEGEERGTEGSGEEVDSTGTNNHSSTADVRQQPTVPAPPPGHTPHPWLRHRTHAHHMPRFPGDPPVQNLPTFPMGAGGYVYPPFYMSPYAAVNHAQMQQWYQAYYGRPIPGGVEGDGVGVEEGGEDIDLPNAPDQQDNGDVDQDDVPMNAGGFMMGGPQFQARRDLVDYGYMLLMALFLVSVAYITSSFGRLVLFLAGILFMLMNQAGWFSLQRRVRHAPPAGGEDLPDPLARHQARQQQEEREGSVREEEEGGRGEAEEGGEGQEQEALPEDTTDGPSETSQQAVPAESPAPLPAPPRPGMLATFFTFITTFFTSLVPQQQPELQFN